jgi:hypothetical protein
VVVEADVGTGAVCFLELAEGNVVSAGVNMGLQGFI